MITHIKTKGFKGFDINEDIHPKTLFFGKNRSGKSTRAAAIALTILGYIPFAVKTNKKPADILNDFGQGNTLTTAVICNGVEFERHLSRSEEGSVSQRLRVNKKKYSAQDFALELYKAGNPKIIDVGDFMAKSDQKKIDCLFDLFPPKANLKNLETQIDKAKKTVNELQKKETSAVSTIKRLTVSKSEVELPAGTLAEVRADIEKVITQVKEAQENLKQVEIEQAKTDAAEKAKAEQKKESQEKFDRIMADNAEDFHPSKPDPSFDGGHPPMINENFKASTPGNQRIHDFAAGKPGPFDDLQEHDPVVSIQKILDALNNSGCQICAAAIIAKQELKKFKKEVAA
jgi:hypothetical protein